MTGLGIPRLRNVGFAGCFGQLKSDLFARQCELGTAGIGTLRLRSITGALMCETRASWPMPIEDAMMDLKDAT